MPSPMRGTAVESFIAIQSGSAVAKSRARSRRNAFRAGLGALFAAFAMLFVAAPVHAQAVTTTLTDADEPHGVAINPVTNKIYLAERAGILSVIDGATNTVSTATNPNGASYWALAVNPVTNYVYAINQDTSSIDVFSGATASAAAQ